MSEREPGVHFEDDGTVTAIAPPNAELTIGWLGDDRACIDADIIPAGETRRLQPRGAYVQTVLRVGGQLSPGLAVVG